MKTTNKTPSPITPEQRAAGLWLDLPPDQRAGLTSFAAVQNFVDQKLMDETLAVCDAVALALWGTVEAQRAEDEKK